MRHRPIYVSIAECGRVQGVAVVIDVLRAFSTAAWAFGLGAERIVLSDDLDEALALKASIPRALALKDAEPAEGFELSNSPVELQAYGNLAGRTIVQKTTAGTVGAVAAKAAEQLYCAAFLTAGATANEIRDSGAAEVYYVVTGSSGTAEEDRACAEYIAALVEEPGVDSAPFLRRARESNAARIIRRRVEAGTPGVHERDISACLEADRFDFAMRARDEDGLLVLRRL